MSETADEKQMKLRYADDRVVDEPVEYAYDPLSEALGWVVRSCAGVEFWMVTLISETDPDCPYVAAKRLPSSQLISKLRGRHARVEPLLDRAEDLFAARHALVHGLGMHQRDRTVLRIELARKAELKTRVEHFDRARLLRLAEEGRALCGQMQELLSSPGGLLDDDEDN